MNILITGIAGFIGSHLAERLIAEGHKVCGIDCFTPTYTRTLKCLNADALRAQGVNIWSLDLAVDDLHAAVRDVDVVYHLAAQPGLSATTAIDDYIRNNIIATQRLLEAVSAVDTVYAFINISTSSVYGMNATGDEASEPKPISSYGVTKLAAEQFVLARTRSTQFPTCSLRLFSVYGPRERPDKLFFRVIRSILEEQALPLFENSDNHLRSFTYIADVVDACVAVLDHWERCIGEIFNIGTDTSVSTREGIRIAETLLGKQVIIKPQPKRIGDQYITSANIDKARNVLGYQPKISLQTGLSFQVEWYLQHIFNKIKL